ncbi:GNAT family N-acetyltransferase [Clostridium sp. C2-6-12]|uniref:GNAT family N-acetyltransferase n=1 Tax=Clostridium sp. C2-6-12 TaxID=2698832 RepID=UPI00137195B0|nr:GNAT family N-acetyltransferase [Clostridium sp. C2-6-12]
MVIRKANDSDIELIANLYIENWKKTYRGLLSNEFLNSLKVSDGIQKWQEYLKKERHMIFVAYEDEKFLGFSACKEDDEIESCLYLDSLHVSEASRGKGIGTKLINTVGHYAYSQGYKCMSICIVKGNSNAKILYEKLGATHYKDFIDYFGGTQSNSEKLIWDNLNSFVQIQIYEFH